MQRPQSDLWWFCKGGGVNFVVAYSTGRSSWPTGSWCLPSLAGMKPLSSFRGYREFCLEGTAADCSRPSPTFSLSSRRTGLVSPRLGLPLPFNAWVMLPNEERDKSQLKCKTEDEELKLLSTLGGIYSKNRRVICNVQVTKII